MQIAATVERSPCGKRPDEEALTAASEARLLVHRMRELHSIGSQIHRRSFAHPRRYIRLCLSVCFEALSHCKDLPASAIRTAEQINRYLCCLEFSSIFFVGVVLFRGICSSDTNRRKKATCLSCGEPVSLEVQQVH